MKYALLALLLVAVNASATKTNEGCQGNCPSTGGGTTNNEANSHADGGNGYGGSSTGVGLGVGVGLGGAGGSGGEGGHGGSGGIGVGTGGDASAGVIGSGNSHNQNTAKGGSAHQGQSQGQSLNSANLLRMTSENTVNASSANDNRSSASGNTTVTNVGGDSTLVERNAPPVFLGALTPTSCGGGFNAGGSSRDGAGAFGIQWVGKECRMRMIGDRYHALGMVDTACEVYKATKGFKDAAKANPKLRDLDCTIKPAPAAVVVPVAPELAPRIPRG